MVDTISEVSFKVAKLAIARRDMNGTNTLWYVKALNIASAFRSIIVSSHSRKLTIPLKEA